MENALATGMITRHATLRLDCENVETCGAPTAEQDIALAVDIQDVSAHLPEFKASLIANGWTTDGHLWHCPQCKTLRRWEAGMIATRRDGAPGVLFVVYPPSRRVATDDTLQLMLTDPAGAIVESWTSQHPDAPRIADWHVKIHHGVAIDSEASNRSTLWT